MGIGFRIFIVDDDDTLRRLSMARYQRLVRGEPDERLAQYAGKRVRFAMVVLEVEGRTPLAIRRIDYYYRTFDSEGRIDATERERQMRMVMNVLPPIVEKKGPREVIDARSRFAKKRYEREFKWKPGRKIEAAIIAAIFGKGPF